MNGKDAAMPAFHTTESRKAARATAHRADRAATGVIWGVAMLGLAVLSMIIFAILWNGLATALTPGFVFGSPKAMGATGGGIWPNVVSSFYLAFLTLVIVLPIGVMAAMYMSEFAREGRITRAVRFGADTLSSVPSIVFGIFGMVLFVIRFGFGYSMLAGALTLSLLNLPVVMRNAEQSLSQVPNTYREASLGLGAGRWQTMRKVILPVATPGITTGVILTIGRILGESAAVIYTVGIFSKFIPRSPLDPGSPMAANIWHWYTEGALVKNWAKIAGGEAALLLLIVLAFNLLARLIAHLYKRKTRGSGRFV
jgi:phosphate transport system permease protein